MILQHIMDMPRLYSGIDRQGRPWTCLRFPDAFGRALAAMPSSQRVRTLKGLYADFKATTGVSVYDATQRG